MARRKADGVERLYEHIKRRAVEFSFDPGQKVKEGMLAAEYGVSRTPVREALNRLVAEGLMSFVPNRGFFCRDIDAAEILGLYQVRAALEMWAFRKACRFASDEALQTTCDYWLSGASTEAYASLNAYDEEFHRALAGLAGNDLLIGQLRHIEEQIFAFRNLEIVDLERRNKTLEEHRAILAQLRDRQAEFGALLLEQHILNSAEKAIAAARVRFSGIAANS